MQSEIYTIRMKRLLTYLHWQLSPHNADAPIEGIDDIHQSIVNILSTRKGTDILRPQFGSNHFDYIDQPDDIAIPNFVQSIINALEDWEPRIVVERVEILGSAPHFTATVFWSVKDDIEREFYETKTRVIV